MHKTSSRSVFLELNEAKFVPRKSSEPSEVFLTRFFTQHDAQQKAEAERELVAETLGIETRQVQRREREKHEPMPTSSYRPASLPPPMRLAEENEEMPNFEDEFYTKKREFRRLHRKEEQISWSRANVDLLTHRKERRDVQRESELKKREEEERLKRLEQELKET